jgi:ATP synthase protein I
MDSSWPASQIDPPVRPLTRDEAKALLAQQPKFSLSLLLAAQLSVGVLVALVWWGLSGRPDSALSALYGAAVAVVPNVLMARGVFGSQAGATVGGLVLWELVKMVVVGVMLAFAPVLIRALSWPAMLVSMLLCMKVMGAALLWLGRPKRN